MSEKSRQSEAPYASDPSRQKLLGRFVTGTMIVAAIVYPTTLLRVPVFGFTVIAGVQFLLSCLFLGTFLARRYLDPRIAAGAMILNVVAWVLTAVDNYGVFAPAHVVVPVVVVLSSLVFGRRVALGVLSLVIGGLVLIGVLYLSGVLYYQVDPGPYAHSWTSWIALLVVQASVPAWYLFLVAPLNDAQRHLAERLDAVLQGMNDALFIHDKDSGAILQVNERMCEMFGCSSEEALRLDVGELSAGTAPYTLEGAREWMSKAVSEGPQMFEWQVRDRAGKLFWVEVNMRPVNLDGTQRLLALVRDISARKQGSRDHRTARRFAGQVPARECRARRRQGRGSRAADPRIQSPDPSPPKMVSQRGREAIQEIRSSYEPIRAESFAIADAALVGNPAGVVARFPTYGCP